MSHNHEIERKFLVKKPLHRILELYDDRKTMIVQQRYLNGSGDWTTRIRRTIVDEKVEYWLTFKQRITDVTCVELETQIDGVFYTNMTKHCGPDLNKIRFQIRDNGNLWELDQFTHPVFEGLVVAEIELPSEDTPFTKPSWLGKEVTQDKQYKNAKMVKRLM